MPGDDQTEFVRYLAVLWFCCGHALTTSAILLTNFLSVCLSRLSSVSMAHEFRRSLPSVISVSYKEVRLYFSVLGRRAVHPLQGCTFLPESTIVSRYFRNVSLCEPSPADCLPGIDVIAQSHSYGSTKDLKAMFDKAEQILSRGMNPGKKICLGVQRQCVALRASTQRTFNAARYRNRGAHRLSPWHCSDSCKPMCKMIDCIKARYRQSHYTARRLSKRKNFKVKKLNTYGSGFPASAANRNRISVTT